MITRSDIDRIFTDKVSELLAKGFTIHTATMWARPDEISRIDFWDGSRVYRLLLMQQGLDGNSYGNYIVIRLCIPPEKRMRNTGKQNKEPVTIFEIKLAHIANDLFTTPEEGYRMAGIRSQRTRRNTYTAVHKVSEAEKLILLRWLRKQPGMQSCELEDITVAEREAIEEKEYYRISAKRTNRHPPP